MHFHLQANTGQKDSKGKLTDYIIASEYYIDADDFLNLRTCIGCIIGELANTSKQELEEIKEDAADLEKLISKLDNIDNKGAFTSEIRDLRKKLKLIPEKV